LHPPRWLIDCLSLIKLVIIAFPLKEPIRPWSSMPKWFHNWSSYIHTMNYGSICYKPVVTVFHKIGVQNYVFWQFLNSQSSRKVQIIVV
jgi:hypothetical protein